LEAAHSFLTFFNQKTLKSDKTSGFMARLFKMQAGGTRLSEICSNKAYK